MVIKAIPLGYVNNEDINHYLEVFFIESSSFMSIFFNLFKYIFQFLLVCLYSLPLIREKSHERGSASSFQTYDTYDLPEQRHIVA